jgi:hypothetical protein
MLVKPVYSLQESLLSAKPLGLDAQISSHGKTVRNATEQIDLIWLLGPNQDGLRLMTQFSGEYGVCLSCRNGEWASNSGQLLVGDKAE